MLTMAGALLFIPQHVADEQAPAHHRGRVALHLTTALAPARGDLAGAGAGAAHLVALEPQPRRCRGAGRARERLRAARAACSVGHLSPRRRGHSKYSHSKHSHSKYSHSKYSHSKCSYSKPTVVYLLQQLEFSPEPYYGYTYYGYTYYGYLTMAGAQQLEFSPEQEEGLLNACQMIVAVASVIHSLKLTLTLALNLPNPSSNPNP